MSPSSRSRVALVDCHTPHETTGKYMTKATDGVRHSFDFTTGRYADAPQITATKTPLDERRRSLRIGRR